MIEGDETTLKSILEERNELKQKLGSKLGSSDESDYDVALKIEETSEKFDEADSDHDGALGKNKKRKKKLHAKILKQKLKKRNAADDDDLDDE